MNNEKKTHYFKKEIKISFQTGITYPQPIK